MSTKKKKSVPIRKSMDRLANALIAHMAKEETELAGVKTQQKKFEKQMDATADTVKDMRDILSSFRIASLVARWLTVIAVGVTSIYAGYDTVKSHMITIVQKMRV